MKSKKALMLILSTLFLASISLSSCETPTINSGLNGTSSIYHEPGEVYVSSLEVVTPPTRTSYVPNEEAFDSTGMIIKAIWSDGYVEDNVSSNKYYYEPSGLLPAGTNHVTVYYGDASVRVDISTTESYELYIIQIPIKTDYVVGEYFDPTGLVLGYQVSGAKKEIEGYDINDVTFNRKTLNKQDTFVTVTYNKLSINVPIKVRGQSLKVELEDSSYVTCEGGCKPKNAIYFDSEKGKWMNGSKGYDTEEAAYAAHTEATKAQLENASGKNFLAYFDEGDESFTIKITPTTSKMNFYLRGASNAVGMYSDEGHSKPIESQDMSLNTIMNIDVNNAKHELPYNTILPGMKSETESHYVWTNWATVNLGVINLNVGVENVISVSFNKGTGMKYQWGYAYGQYDYVLFEEL